MSATPEVLLATVDLTTFGQRLKAQRLTRGLTQDALAGDEITAAYVSRIEAGQRRPELSIAKLLAERLDTTLEHLVTGVAPRVADELRLALRYAELALSTGEAVEAEAQVGQLLTDPELSLGPLRREAEWVHARCLEALGRLPEAAVRLEALAADHDHKWWLPSVIALCRCYREAGDLSRSIDVGEQALRYAETVGLDGTEDAIRLTVSLVGAYFERGDELYAEQLCRSAIARADTLQSPMARASAYWNASNIAMRRREYDEAVRLADKAVALMSETDDARSLARLRRSLAYILVQQTPPDVPQIHRLIKRARKDLVTADGTIADIARCDVVTARAHLYDGGLDAAKTAATDVLRALPTGQCLTIAAEAEAILGKVDAASADRTGARRHYRNAVGHLTAGGADRAAAGLWVELGELFDAAGDTANARDAYRSATASLGLRSPQPVVAPV